jgi:hypothetical protein
MSGKRSKRDTPRMLLDGRSPEEQKAILEDMNRVALRHKITHSTAIGTDELHVVTLEDFKNAQVGAKSRAGATEGGNAQRRKERILDSASNVSDTMLMERIGGGHGLKRSAAIAAIKRGLAALRK